MTPTPEPVRPTATPAPTYEPPQRASAAAPTGDQATIGKGLVIKRFHARGRGRAGKILKPFSHLTIVVRQVEAAA